MLSILIDNFWYLPENAVYSPILEEFSVGPGDETPPQNDLRTMEGASLFGLSAEFLFSPESSDSNYL